MWNFIKSWFATVINTGVLPDTRSAEEKANDIQHSEFTSGAVQWIEKPSTSWRHFPERNQSSSGSCVMQSNAKARGATEAIAGSNFPILSAREYNQRSNYPEEGTIPMEGLQITAKGLSLESFYPSQEMTEEQINVRYSEKSQAILDSEKMYSGGTPVQLPIDIDSIAQALDAGFGVVICCAFPESEWQYVPIVTSGIANCDHQIAVVDRTLFQGQKTLVCEDSAFLSTSQNGQRLITEKELLARCYFTGYVRKTNPPAQGAVARPVHTFTTDLEFGMTGSEVLNLQQYLVFKGFLSKDCMTGYFGNLTKQALITLQIENNISPAIGYCGSITRNFINLN